MAYDNKIARYTEADLFAAFLAGDMHGARVFHPISKIKANESIFEEFKATLNKELTWDDIKKSCPYGNHIIYWLNKHYTPPKGLSSYKDILWKDYENPWEYLKDNYPDLTDVKPL